ncbi:hypothetical protein ACFV2H_51860 [Streptomyces sp. NPDC059629]|uniref:hypothetical protein n=1 Tax=Streptomyces sp. NPDC059629 TaxID=3346889 RepID=UPI00369F6D3F
MYDSPARQWSRSEKSLSTRIVRTLSSATLRVVSVPAAVSMAATPSTWVWPLAVRSTIGSWSPVTGDPAVRDLPESERGGPASVGERGRGVRHDEVPLRQHTVHLLLAPSDVADGREDGGLVGFTATLTQHGEY